MEKKFQQVTIIISSDDFGGDSTPPLDILYELIRKSPDLDLISIQDVKDMHLTITEVD